MVPEPSTAIVWIGCAQAVVFLFSSEFVLNVSLEKRGRTWKGGCNSGHGLAGACLVRLTRTPIVILYAQPKTPIDFLRFATSGTHEGDRSSLAKQELRRQVVI